MSAFLKAKKIWLSTELTLNVYADFIEKFELREVKPTELYISADSGYIAYINGVVIDGFQFADFENYKVYDKFDITGLLKAGENTLHVIGYSQGESSFTYKLGDPGVIYEVRSGEEVLCCSGEDTLCRLNPNYKSGEVEKLTWQVSYSFRYDATVKGDDFGKRAVLKETNYPYYPRPVKQLEVLDRCPSKIQATGYYYAPQDKSLQSGEYMKQSALVTLSGKEMGYDISHKMLPSDNGIEIGCDKGDGIFVVVDLLGETAGYLDFDIEVPDECEIHIGFGEHINSLRVRTSIDGRQFAAVFKAINGKNKFTHRMKRFAGRYIELHIPAKWVKLNYIGMLPTEYPCDKETDFVPKDLLHKKIYEVSKRTLKLCMHEHFEDCPWREQALYAMDGHVEMLSGYLAFEEYEFARASLKLFSLSQRENGQIELCAPADSPIYIPSFTLCFVIAVEEYIRFSKDFAFASEVYPVLRHLIDSFKAKIGESGLVTPFTEPEAWNFYEWAPGLDGRVPELWPGDTVFDYVNEAEGKSLSAPLNAYFSLALSAFSKILSAIGRENEALDAEKLRDSVNTSLLKTFWNDEKQLFASYLYNGELKHYAELTQALLIAAGATDENKTAKLRDTLMSDNGLIPVTLGSSFYKYEALLTDPFNADFVFSDIADKWGNMLFSGATSFWETFKGDDEFTFCEATSLCHGWASLPIYFYNIYGKDIV